MTILKYGFSLNLLFASPETASSLVTTLLVIEIVLYRNLPVNLNSFLELSKQEFSRYTDYLIDKDEVYACTFSKPRFDTGRGKSLL